MNTDDTPPVVVPVFSCGFGSCAVFQKDLGPDTAAAAKAITTFNPDDTWKRVVASAVAEGKDS